MLRKKGVVGKFVEFYGPGVATLPVADRATIGNMAPEYGATVGIFPVDQETLRYLEFTGRPKEQVQLVEAYMKEQGLFHSAASPEPVYSDTLSLDLATVEPSLAGPRRPQDRVALGDVPRNFQLVLPTLVKPTSPIAPPWDVRNHWEAEGGQPFGGATAVAAPPHRSHVDLTIDGTACKLHHGSVVIAAITSCTNTSNPSVMLAAGLVAKKAVERVLTSQPWVKTSLAPGSKVVTDYLQQAGLMRYLEQLRFHLVGYGCTTCIGNSGPLPEPVSNAVAEGELVVCAVLSGNRNFEGRIQQEVRANYLASPPLVVAYALAGRIDLDLQHEPLGTGRTGSPSISGTSGHPPGKWTTSSAPRSSRRCSARSTVRSSREMSAGAACRCPRGTGSPGSPTRPTSAGRHTSTGCRPPRPRSRTSARRGCCACSVTALRPTTSPPPARSARRVRRGSISWSAASSRRTSTPTAHAAATTRSWCAVHSRTCGSRTCSRPAPRDPSPCTCPTASSCRSTTRRCSTRQKACPCSCSRARSTAPAPPVTGRRRGRGYSACAP